jgi:hypothetical protein
MRILMMSHGYSPLATTPKNGFPTKRNVFRRVMTLVGRQVMPPPDGDISLLRMMLLMLCDESIIERN